MKLVDILDIGADPADEPDLRIRKRTAVAVALAFMAVGVVFGLANLARERPAFVVLAMVQIVAFGTALVLYRRSHRLTPLITMMAITGLAVLFASLIPAGGMSWGIANLIWIVLVPIAAVLFLGARAGPLALAGVVAVVAAGVVIDPFIRSAPPEPSLARLLLAAVNLIGPAVIALVLVVFIDGERLRAKAESDALLLNVLPRSIADRLKRGERVIADHYDEVTILFADVVDFTPFAASETPARVVAVLNEVFSRFDTLAERHGLEKIKTIGDAYMVVAGAPEPRADHAAVIVDMALEMQDGRGPDRTDPWEPASTQDRHRVRPAVAGVIGRGKFSYDVWGDAVNLASRMESTGVPGAIQVAASTWRMCGDRYPFTSRDVEVKGLGALRTYLLDPRLDARGRGRRLTDHCGPNGRTERGGWHSMTTSVQSFSASGARWDEDTMVLVYSATKGMSALAMALAESRGLFDYDERVCTYWPEFAQAGKDQITVRQLLAHQAGLFAFDEPVDGARPGDQGRRPPVTPTTRSVSASTRASCCGGSIQGTEASAVSSPTNSQDHSAWSSISACRRRSRLPGWRRSSARVCFGCCRGCRSR